MEGNWNFLPIELLRKILCRLFFEDAISFSCVCKDWKLAATDFYDFLSPMDCPTPSQWLMFSNLHNTTFKFYNPFYNVFYERDIPELSGAVIRFSKNGWLLMSRGYHSTFFFNPFTRQRIDLPDLEPRTSFECCFTSVPTAPECMVVICYSFNPNYSILYTLDRGEDIWCRDDFENDKDFHSSPCHSVFHNNKCYFLGWDGQLARIQLYKDEDEEKEEFWKLLDKPKPISEKLMGESYLMEHDGQLFSLFVDCNGEKVSLYRLDESIMTWKRVKNLGDNMIMVSNCSSFITKKKADGMENKIYFPRFYKGDLVFYSLETNKFETFNTDFSSNSLLHTEEMLHCCWIEPNFEHAKEGLQWMAVDHENSL